MNDQTPTARTIAERGLAIYRRKYLADFERQWRGHFAAIDIDSEEAYIADYPEQALAEAKRAAPKCLFYLVRVGFQATFSKRRQDATYDRASARQALWADA
jgi:hypothetical protein